MHPHEANREHDPRAAADNADEPTPGPGHMTADEFRRVGHRMVDWIADYWSRVESMPVLSRAAPGDILAALPDHAPDTGFESPASWDGVFDDLERIILPGITHWQSPNFFAYFPANASGPAVLGELLSAGLGVQGMLWQTGPACTELEIRVMDWLGEAIGLPDVFLSRHRANTAEDRTRAEGRDLGSSDGGGVIQGTASEAALVAIVAARRRALGALNRRDRTDDSRLVAYASEQAHSSIVKAAVIAGICADASDRRRLRLVPTNERHEMDVGELSRLMREDRDAGLVPFFIVASVGTTGSTAVDSIDAIASAVGATRGSPEAPTLADGTAAQTRMPIPWLHVDAAHAGAAMICPEFREMIRGVERADSFCFNPHKWLLVNFDCDCFWVRDRSTLIDALSVTPEYLRNAASDSGRVVDFRDWQVPLGRRFRALKLWLVMRHYGLERLRIYIREHVRWAQEFESLVAADPRFEVAAPRTLNLVCFRLRGEGPSADARNRSLMERLNASGAVYLTHTSLPAWKNGARVPGESRVALRLAIGATATRRRHVLSAWERIARDADAV